MQPKPFINSSATWHCPEPSASMNEGVLGEILPSDALLQFAHETLKAIRVAARGATDACRALHADTSQSEGGRHVASSKISFKLCKPALGLVDKAAEKFGQEIARLESKTKEPSIDGTVKNIQLQTEIRLYLRDASPEDRRFEITEQSRPAMTWLLLRS